MSRFDDDTRRPGLIDRIAAAFGRKGGEQHAAPARPPSGGPRSSTGRGRRGRFIATQVEALPVGRIYSSFVRLAKIVLPVVAIGLFLLVFAWPQIDWQEEVVSSGSLEIKPEDAENLRMTSARFVGVDSEGRPFTLTADEASQSGGDDDPVRLVKPQGDMTMRDGGWVTVSAERGVYYRTEEALELFGSVTLYHDEGYEITSEQAWIDLRNGAATGNRPVLGFGPLGEIEGEGFRIVDRGETIIVLGKSRLLVRDLPDSTPAETHR